MVRLATASLAAAAILSGTALAQSSNDLYERSLSDADYLAAREPMRFGALGGMARRVMRGGSHEHRHEHHHSHVDAQAGDPQQQAPPQDGTPQRREFVEELEAREPMRFGALGGMARRVMRGGSHEHRHEHHHSHIDAQAGDQQQQAPPQDGTPQRREFVEYLEAREPVRFGYAMRGMRSGHSHEHHSHERHEHDAAADQQQQAPPQDGTPGQRREFLEAREPSRFSALGGVARRVMRSGSHEHHHAHIDALASMAQSQGGPPQDNTQPQRRELADDLAAREPMRFGALGGMARRVMRGGSHEHRHEHHHSHVDAQGGDQQQQAPPQDGTPQRRELADYLETREPARYGRARRRMRKERLSEQPADQQQQQQQQDPSTAGQRRELYDMEDILERAFEDFDDLD